VWVAGPSAGGLLADWGAEVIKLEPPDGDPMRRMLQVVIGHGAPESPPFDLDNRGKQSVVLDLSKPEARDVALRLIDEADVFLTNLRPEAVDRLGLGPEALMRRNSRLVYASLTGYGREGPDAGRAGYDVGAFWARSGIALATVPPGDSPPALRGGVGDHVAGVTTTAGILAALLSRERTGRGQLVETSLLRCGIYCLGWDLGLALKFDKVSATVPRTDTINPMVNPYEASDGLWFWLLGVESDRHFPKLCTAIGQDELSSDERFEGARGRRHNAAELIAILDAEFATRSRAEWIERFDANDVWWAPVNSPEDVLADPQAIAAGAFVDVPGGTLPAHRAVATPVDFSANDGTDLGPTPGLGEHTASVLADAGFTPDEVAQLRDVGAIPRED
jgi:crotonobetainyl-CoA:carnitine CoA-transferase CaiB-like acyl-CoA transferase